MMSMALPCQLRKKYGKRCYSGSIVACLERPIDDVLPLVEIEVPVKLPHAAGCKVHERSRDFGGDGEDGCVCKLDPPSC